MKTKEAHIAEADGRVYIAAREDSGKLAQKVDRTDEFFVAFVQIALGRSGVISIGDRKFMIGCFEVPKDPGDLQSMINEGVNKAKAAISDIVKEGGADETK